MALEDRIRLPALNLIHRRSRLLNRLTEFVEANKRLITVYAPGGYGKSILLADFAQATDLPICWCALDPADRDPTSFLTLLARSITDRFHEIEADSLLDLVEQGDTQASVRQIADSLTDVGPHIIIFDDYHKAVSTGMTLTLNQLLDQLPPASIVIVAARGDMMLETSQVLDLIINEQATGLSEEELRFTPVELQRVMRKRFGRRIEMDSVAEITRATDGNIAQILLAGHLMHAGVGIGQLPRLGDDQMIIYDYLAESVLGKQSPELQRFLMHTSILPDMTPGLCNDLLEINDASFFLDELVRKELFVNRIGTMFRYHDLFAEFLQAKLAEDKSLYDQVSIKAAGIMDARSRHGEAISLYISAQAWDEATTVLVAKGRSFYETGRALTLHQWLSGIPEEVLVQYPSLLLLQGQILNVDLGKPEVAIEVFQKAEKQFLAQDDLIGVAQAQVWQSVSLRLMGRAKGSLDMAEKGLRQLENSKTDKSVLAWAIRQRGVACENTGNSAEALKDLRRALELFQSINDSYNAGLCHHDVAIALARPGDIKAASYHFGEAIQIWEDLGNDSHLANTLNNSGVTLYRVGRYNKALEQFTRCLEILSRTKATGLVAYVKAGIGDIYLARKEYEKARQAYQESNDFAHNRSLVIYNTVMLGECCYQEGYLDQAFDLADQARQLATEIGLNFERGLACLVAGKVLTIQSRKDSFALFEEALICFSENDVLEQAKVRLWWGYSLLLELRATAAFGQLEEALRLIKLMGELRAGLLLTLDETEQLLLHFRYRPDISQEIRNNIRSLMWQEVPYVKISEPGLQVFAFGQASLIAGREFDYFFNMRGNIQKLPELLLYFILEGQKKGLRRGEITAAIWPDLTTDNARNAFHQSLRRLRSGILKSPDFIIASRDYYSINNDHLKWCDVLAFDALFEKTLTSLPPEEILDLQLEMISLYRGEFLDDFELGEEWGVIQRSKYEDLFLQTVHLVSRQLLQNDDVDQAIPLIKRGLSYDYYREELHRGIAEAYAKRKRYDDLSKHYRELCEVFESELGGPPMMETQNLYEQLLARK